MNKPRSQKQRVSDRAQALARLIESLGDNRPPEPTDAATARKRYVAGLLAIGGFLDNVDANVGNAPPKIQERASAISDLAPGSVHPALRAAPKNRSPGRSDISTARVDVIIGVEFLVSSGKSIAEAVKLAIRKHPGLKTLLRPGAGLC